MDTYAAPDAQAISKREVRTYVSLNPKPYVALPVSPLGRYLNPEKKTVAYDRAEAIRRLNELVGRLEFTAGQIDPTGQLIDSKFNMCGCFQDCHSQSCHSQCFCVCHINIGS